MSLLVKRFIDHKNNFRFKGKKFNPVELTTKALVKFKSNKNKNGPGAQCTMSCVDPCANNTGGGEVSRKAIIITGGYPNDQLGKTAEVLYADGTSWKIIPDMTLSRFSHAQVKNFTLNLDYFLYF